LAKPPLVNHLEYFILFQKGSQCQPQTHTEKGIIQRGLEHHRCSNPRKIKLSTRITDQILQQELALWVLVQREPLVLRAVVPLQAVPERLAQPEASSSYPVRAVMPAEDWRNSPVSSSGYRKGTQHRPQL